MHTKKYRTNSLHVREQIRAHIVETISNYCGDEFDTIEKASSEIMRAFNSWDCEYEQRRNPSHQERFSDWLWGLPFNFEYTHHGIQEFLDGLGINPEGKEFDTEKSGKLYHYLIWSEVQKATA